MPEIIYRQSFFDALAQRIGRRCKMSAEEIQSITPLIERSIPRHQLWRVMCEIATWLSRQGITGFISIYDDSPRRAPFQVNARRIADDIAEISAWYAGKNGHTLRLGAPFPTNAYEQQLLVEMFYAFYRRLVDGVDFEAALKEGLTADSLRLAQTILHSQNTRLRVEAYRQFADRISVAALEFVDDVVRALPCREQAVCLVFLDERLEEHTGFIDGAMMRIVVAEFVAVRQVRGQIWFSPLPQRRFCSEGRRPVPIPLLC